MAWYNRVIAGALSGLLIITSAAATELKVQPVAPNVYALVGELGQRSPDNLGNNATFGVVVTSKGVVLIDAGGSRAGAEAIEKTIQSLTDLPVVAVVNTGGQDHRWMGNAYFQAKGARVLATSAAVADQKARADKQFQGMANLIGTERVSATQAVHADDLVDARRELVIDGMRIELIPAGWSHTPGVMIVWLPETRTAFAGDIVYMDRMLGVLDVSRTKDWIAAFDILAGLDPAHVVPGHGDPGTLEKARADSRDYLAHLRQQVRRLIDTGGDMNAAAAIDQSDFLRLVGADQLAKRNAMQVFAEMEFE
ncbi:MBL fold metallo-hydrolase [Magnetospirillum sp. 64-120]|uniref:MBL fold metallo-hydrolase n=1 Tax=Magnetospirillum sp. 64-120 TaxID=1895778 RepID=UPI0025BAE4CE|nr:MBL fold metallo-hydrolase [Magnetospirillum sp. 64-120]